MFSETRHKLLIDAGRRRLEMPPGHLDERIRGLPQPRRCSSHERTKDKVRRFSWGEQALEGQCWDLPITRHPAYLSKQHVHHESVRVTAVYSSIGRIARS
jgi:hypothetical protein